MRAFLAIICPAILSTAVFAEFDLAPESNDPEVKLIHAAEPEAGAFALFRKKKKGVKTSKKIKRHNKSMGKTLKRKNDDTLRR